MRLQGKVALITGGGIRIGRSLTLALAEAGCDVLVHYGRSRQQAEATCESARAHGVRAEVSILSRTLPRVSDVILRFVKEHAMDLLVMGAYGHSRFREAILGGATRDILESADLPVLMAH